MEGEIQPCCREPKSQSSIKNSEDGGYLGYEANKTDYK